MKEAWHRRPHITWYHQCEMPIKGKSVEKAKFAEKAKFVEKQISINME